MHRGHGRALDAGNLHQTFNRIASHSEHVLHGDLGGGSDLIGCAAHRGYIAASRHRGGRADLRLTAAVGRCERGISLYERANSGGSQQKVEGPLFGGLPCKFFVKG